MALSSDRMADNYKSAVVAITKAGGDPNAMADAIMKALFAAVVNEIKSNSELVSVTHDTGSAGAGIITGKVG